MDAYYYPTTGVWETCTSTAIGTDHVWYSWTSSSSATTSDSYLTYTWSGWNEKITEKHENRERRRALEAQAKIEKTERDKEEKDAEVTANELLGELIGDDELAVYKETGRLFVKGRQHDYMLYRDGKVRRIEKDRIVDLCIHHKWTGEMLPKTDKVIGMKLAIEANQKGFDREANDLYSRQREAELPKAACM